jgi:hypothetical protein
VGMRIYIFMLVLIADNYYLVILLLEVKLIEIVRFQFITKIVLTRI